jgi:3-oxoacyl-[acyl-carrier-protein] synthase III
MRWDGVYFHGVGAVLGELVLTDTAVTAGRYDPGLAEMDGYLSTSVRSCGPAVHLGVRAGGLALRRSALDRAACSLVVHAYTGFQGLDDFASAAYIQRECVGGSANAIEVKQASNGGLAALEMAAAYLAARRDDGFALIATSDLYQPPVTDRYLTPGTVFGDGGTAVVISRRPGWARLLATSTVADTTHEGIQRGGEEWASHPGANGWPVAMSARIENYVKDNGEEVFVDLVSRIGTAERQTMDVVLADAGIRPDQVSRWVFPNMGLSLTDWDARADYGAPISRSTWEWGRRVGHLGGGDQFAALEHLALTGAVSDGDLVLLHGAGTGFTYTSALLEILTIPPWSHEGSPTGPEAADAQ